MPENRTGSDNLETVSDPKPALLTSDGTKDAEPVRLLLVEDNEDDVFLTMRAFNADAPHISIDAVQRGEEAIRRAAEARHDVVVLDFKLPDMDGLEVLRGIARPDLPVIMVTGKGDQKLALEALKSGAEDYLVKESGYHGRLPQAVIGAVRRNRLNRENQRLAEETAQQADLLETVLNTDPAAIAVFRGPELRFELANPSLKALIADFSDIDLLGKSLAEAIPNSRNPHLRQTLYDVYENGVPAHLEGVALPLQPGVTRYFDVHVLPLSRAAHTKERRVVAILWEVTEAVTYRQRVEALARNAEAERAWLQKVIDQLPEGVFIASAPGGDLLLANRAAVEILGRDPYSSPSTTNLEEFGIRNPDGSPLQASELPIMRAIEQGETVVGHELRYTHDNVALDLLVSAAPLYDADGKITAGISVFQNITRMKDVERLKDDFMSIASHELRTPLTSLKAAAQLILRGTQRGEYPDKAVSLINTIMQQSDRMTRLIEELLDVTRLQSGNLQLQSRLLDLSALVEEAVVSYRMSKPTFHCHVSTAGPVWVHADHDRLVQVLANLLDNAAKYSPPDSQTEVRIGAGSDNSIACVEVQDFGIGFDPAEAVNLFERFSRLGSAAYHSQGLGLGLFICRQIITAHDGTISAHSEGPGKGATFTITLPLASLGDDETNHS